MKKIINMVCLLMTVGILCIIPQFSVRASSTSTGLTGETTESTTRQDPGTAEDQSDLSQLNIGNTFTITSNEGNGQMNQLLYSMNGHFATGKKIQRCDGIHHWRKALVLT